MGNAGSSGSTSAGRRRAQAGVVVWVAVGGAAGALLRHAVDVAAPVATGAFPWGTFAINAAGALALGALHAYVPAHPWVPVRVRAVLGAGMLGGFTTFSAYAEQTRLLLAEGHAPVAVLYALGTLAAATLAVEAGRRLVAGRGR